MSSANEVDSVLAHLVFGRGVGLKPEDATTEAVVYVLNRSEAVRRRLHELVSSMTGLRLAPVERYETQVQQAENQRPDIVGYSATNQQVLLIENKFWADLTANQPVAYLSVLESDEPGLVLFVCPSTRLDLLWTYLLDRVHRAEITIDDKTDDSTQSNDPRSILLQGGHHALGCISWNRLLRELRQAAQDADDWSTVGDLKQISGLVAQVDADNPFLPLRDENLTQSQGRILLSLQDIDKRLRSRVVNEPRYYQTRSDYTWVYCREAKIRWFGVGINVEMWARWGCSPFWIVIGSWDNNPNYSAIKSAVAGWLAEGPHRAVEGGNQNRPFIAVPVIPPLGVERDVVVSQLAEEAIKIITFVEQHIEST